MVFQNRKRIGNFQPTTKLCLSWTPISFAWQLAFPPLPVFVIVMHELLFSVATIVVSITLRFHTMYHAWIIYKNQIISRNCPSGLNLSTRVSNNSKNSIFFHYIAYHHPTNLCFDRESSWPIHSPTRRFFNKSIYLLWCFLTDWFFFTRMFTHKAFFPTNSYCAIFPHSSSKTKLGWLLSLGKYRCQITPRSCPQTWSRKFLKKYTPVYSHMKLFDVIFLLYLTVM